jgi:hypothetical protein
VTHIVVDGNLRLSDVRKGIGSDQLKVGLCFPISFVGRFKVY